jgi:osmoprotectant transport system permease protein
MTPRVWLLLGPALLAADAAAPPAPVVTVGSKAFTESLILGDMVADLARSAGADVRYDRTRSLGGTQVLWQALVTGEIDVYPEYTGTIRQEILRGQSLPDNDALRRELATRGVRMSRSLGFNNTYALGMKEEVAQGLGVRSFSDLRQHQELRFGFSNEFMKRADGWPALKARYRLPQQDVRGLEHALAYPELSRGAIQVTELYSTDAEIRAYDIRVLVDDLHFFPRYEAVLLYRADLPERAPQAVAALATLEGAISERDMIDMNARVQIDRAPSAQVAADFLNRRFGLGVTAEERGLAARLWKYTREHLFLVAVSLAAAVAVAVPLGVLAAYRPRLGQVVLAGAGILQTIPSLALLVFLIRPFGLGVWPAIVALFLYSLLPVIRNTYAGLHDIPGPLRESAEALGLAWTARLWRIELPMASRAILAGVKTSAVINVGTATLGGLIGAGGYGQPIFQGIPLHDLGMVLEGAVPAAVMALAVQWVFEVVERFVVPRGLRLRTG